MKTRRRKLRDRRDRLVSIFDGICDSISKVELLNLDGELEANVIEACRHLTEAKTLIGREIRSLERMISEI